MAKKRKVFFFSGGELDKEEQMHPWTAAAWEKLFNTVAANSAEQNTVMHRGRMYVASPRTTKSGTTYFRVTVARNKSDWPDVETRDHADPLSVKEYACVFPVENYPYIAVFRSSVGPRSGALESLINSILETTISEGEFVLEPVMRKNAREHLAQSVGVSKINVKYKSSGMSGQSESGSIIDRAVNSTLQIPGLDEADYSVSLCISLKKPKALGPAQNALSKELMSILKDADPMKSVLPDKIQASVIHEKDDQKLQSETIDFIKDQITEVAVFGEDDDLRLSDRDIEAGVAQAIKAFNDTMRKS